MATVVTSTKALTTITTSVNSDASDAAYIVVLVIVSQIICFFAGAGVTLFILVRRAAKQRVASQSSPAIAKEKPKLPLNVPSEAPVTNARESKSRIYIAPVIASAYNNPNDLDEPDEGNTHTKTERRDTNF